MKTMPLIETNPYLHDAESREKLVERAVRTSCGVEGIKPSVIDFVHINIPRRKKRIFEVVSPKTVRAK